MGSNGQSDLKENTRDAGIVGELEGSPSQSPTKSRPSSMVFKKGRTVIPAHLVAEAISTLHGLDLRWSGPITPTEMQYVEQYVFTKYPQYLNGLAEGETSEPDNVSVNDEPDDKRKSPSFSRSLSYHLDQTHLEPSRLLDILTKKSSNFVSIPEIQARNRALKHCGLSEEDYTVVFVLSYKDAMVMIGESYPFFKGGYYMTILNEADNRVREFAAAKESKVIPAPESWLDLRIKGSQLSQFFRKKCKNIPKGLFSYPAVVVGGARSSMHWISEAHRNSWHVLLDATGIALGEESRLALALHRPDFVLCAMETGPVQPSKIVCLLVRRNSFITSTSMA